MHKARTRTVEGKKIPIPSGMVHHWIGSVHIRDVALADVESWVQDPTNFERWVKEVVSARLLHHEGDDYRIYLRLRGKRVKTVHYNTEHEIHFDHHGPGKSSSKTVATRIVQLDDAGTEREREKSRRRRQRLPVAVELLLEVRAAGRRRPGRMRDHQLEPFGASGLMVVRETFREFGAEGITQEYVGLAARRRGRDFRVLIDT